MRKLMTGLAVLALMTLIGTAALAQNTDTQTVTCTVTSLPDLVVAPDTVALSVARKASVESTGFGTVSYRSDTGSRTVTVQATASTGPPVVGAKLSITGGLITTFAAGLLATDVTLATPALLLATALAAADPANAVTNIVLQLDATAVVVSAANQDLPWTYTLTYTLGG